MPEITGTQPFNMEAFVDNISGDIAKGNVEDKKVSKASIRSESEKIRDKREERIKNLQDQLKGVGRGGGCLKVLSAIFKVIDFLIKPISLLTMNKLSLHLSKTVDALRDAKKQQKLLAMKIDGEQIQKVIQNLKKFLSDDVERFKTQDEKMTKETRRIMEILDEIDTTFQAANNI